MSFRCSFVFVNLLPVFLQLYFSEYWLQTLNDLWSNSNVDNTHTFLFISVFLIAPFWWLSRMTEMPFEQQKSYTTLLVYGSIATGSLLLTLISSFWLYFAALKASENLHDQMTKAVMKAPVLFFDTNPAGRILNRFSKDVGCMDDILPGEFLFAIQLCLYFFSATILILAVAMCGFLSPFTVLFIYLAKYYLRSAREIRRLEAITCSPVYSLLADSLAGLEIIRSSEMEDDFLQKFYKWVYSNGYVHVYLKILKDELGLAQTLNRIINVKSPFRQAW